ncbi:MAG: glucoamylase family protein [Planctomycetota bacterium]
MLPTPRRTAPRVAVVAALGAALVVAAIPSRVGNTNAPQRAQTTPLTTQADEPVTAWAVSPAGLQGLGLSGEPQREWAAATSDHDLSDTAFLDLWQRRCLLYFLEHTHPETGLTADRAKAHGPASAGEGEPVVASVASTGFALTALVVGAERGWIDRDEAYQRYETAVRFLYERVDHERGFFYHFVDADNGRRVWACEASSIDTALLLAGALTAAQAFPDTEAARLSQAIYERVEWPWMLDGHATMSMGWTPEGGFIPWRWDHFSEHLVLQLLGLGSPTHPLPAESWDAWTRGPVYEHDRQGFMSFPPLFVHQFSHAWVDFRDQRDDYANYWRNSQLATLAHQSMFDALRKRFPHYGQMLWGVTSSDSADGYRAWGGPDPSPEIDGTIVPCAAAGSIPFAPQACITAVRHMFDAYGETTWRRYGLVDAFNPLTGWVNRDVIGIDVGITLLMIENQRSGLVWRKFMADPGIRLAMDRANFRAICPETESVQALFFDPRAPAPEPIASAVVLNETAEPGGGEPAQVAEPAPSAH